VEELREIANEANVWLLFDAAHAYGALYRGRKVGALGVIEVFSLDATKVVTSAEGGLVASPNSELAARIQYLRNQGFVGDYESKYIGLNAKISELNAALGFLTLDQIEAAIERRHRIAMRYRANLKSLKGLIRFQEIPPANRSTFSHFAIVCEKGRDELQNHLRQAGIQTKRYFRPLHRMQFFAQYSSGQLPKTEWLAEHILCLPIFNDLADSQLDYICHSVLEYYKTLHSLIL
jgi:dTDP-4-amino-4,6-dideoxygalactose transaminase